MWQRFTERARLSVFYAQEEAARLGENCVSTEHLLLGLDRASEDGCIVDKILATLGVDHNRIRGEVEKQVSRGDGVNGRDMELAPRAKRTIDLAYEEARGMNNNYIGTEHLLLALVREGEGLGGRILKQLGLEASKVREVTMKLQSGDITHAPQDNNLKGGDLIGIAQLSREQICTILDLASKLKSGAIPRENQRKLLEGKTLAMIFEKPSLRTRVTFETGIFQLGGHGIYLQPNDIQLGKRETVPDVARNLSRWVDLIMARTFLHSTVTGLAEHASVPVINGLSDLEHPCQALADFLTIIEKKGDLKGLKFSFIGDGNNVAHSLMLLAAKVGTNFTIGCPKGYEPDPKVVELAEDCARETGAIIEIEHDPRKAADGADIIYTDVWASMGQEEETAERARVFADFQVNTELMKCAKPDAIFEHCLPAHRGEEVTNEVIDSPQSVVIDEAENRLHAQKAVMVLLAS